MHAETLFVDSIEQATSQIIDCVGAELIIAAPLGLGKPTGLLNSIYSRAKLAPNQLTLKIYTALSLQLPLPKSDLEQRFLKPFLDRHFGKDYPQLDYLIDVLEQTLPTNISVYEFYFSSGSQLNNAAAQRHYISQNYTHVARDLVQAGVNVLLQQVAKRGDKYSLASNSDVALDLIDSMQQQAKDIYVVAVVNSQMPFLGGEAEVTAERFNLILDDAQTEPLFAIPKEIVGNAEHAIGIHASTLVKDGGTLQIGIGALSDALVNGLIMRHQRNSQYVRALKAFNIDVAVPGQLISDWGGWQPFVKGLYGATEMVMDGFMHLRRAGILSRAVFENIGIQKLLNANLIQSKCTPDTLQLLLDNDIIPVEIDQPALQWLICFGLVNAQTRLDNKHLIFTDGKEIGIDLTLSNNALELSNVIAGRTLKGGRYLEGAFFLGSSELYKWLKQLEGDDWDGLKMQRVSQINQFYGGHESLERVQRREARFFNTCMMHTLLGAAVSDALEDGQVVSGVGGQYNFVAMAHALDDGRSIIMLRSTRKSGAGLQSNICWNYAHTTIPRHLRDIVITEYGIADCRGQCDEEVIKRLLAITDSRFQKGLMEKAKVAGKLDVNFEIPRQWKNNTPARIESALATMRSDGEFLSYPFGSDFDAVEQKLITALAKLKTATASPLGKVKTIFSSLFQHTASQENTIYLARMGLDSPRGLSQKILARLINLYLSEQ